jgi:hypothetical protein
MTEKTQTYEVVIKGFLMRSDAEKMAGFIKGGTGMPASLKVEVHDGPTTIDEDTMVVDDATTEQALAENMADDILDEDEEPEDEEEDEEAPQAGEIG